MSSDRYPFAEIEAKWQATWESRKQFRVTEDPSRPKFYCLEMFPYPSGRIHMGHVRVYAIGDLLARYKWMRGFNVLHPMGWDAFGLPAENAAIEHDVHPAIWTYENIDNMRAQLRKMGISYDWDREVTTCDPAYYKWEQLIFIRMLERGLAYRRRSTVNWCPSCQTVLANEQVEAGRCWRCDSEVTKREIDGWFFKITDYAEELLAWCDRLPGWPERVMTMQRNWIGKSEGAEFDLPVAGRRDLKIRVFTTRPDTAFGVTYAVLAPEHPLVDALDRRRGRSARRSSASAPRWPSRPRSSAPPRIGPSAACGCRRRSSTRSTSVAVPLFIADYVLMTYGTGAIMAVPGEDQRDWDFARQHGLPIVETVQAPGGMDGRGVHGRRREDQLRLPRRAGDPRGQAQGDRLAGRARARRGQGELPPARLGHQSPALLGRADPGRVLPDRRHGAGEGREPPGRAAARRPALGQGRLAAGRGRLVRQHHVPEVRGQGAARDRHDGHLRGVLVVLPPLLLAALRAAGCSTARPPTTGCRWISTSAASSTPSCTCSTRASTPRCCATSASPRSTSRSGPC